MSRDWRDVVPDGARDRTALCLAFLEEFPTEELYRFVGLPAYERLLRLAGLTATGVARDNLSILAETRRLIAEVAHRDRALMHLANATSVSHLCALSAVRDAMAATAPERTIRITTVPDVASLIKALNDLSCALRGKW